MLALNEIIGPLKILKLSNFSLEIQGCKGIKKIHLLIRVVVEEIKVRNDHPCMSIRVPVLLCFLWTPWCAISHLTKADTTLCFLLTCILAFVYVLDLTVNDIFMVHRKNWKTQVCVPEQYEHFIIATRHDLRKDYFLF